MLTNNWSMTIMVMQVVAMMEMDDDLDYRVLLLFAMLMKTRITML